MFDMRMAVDALKVYAGFQKDEGGGEYPNRISYSLLYNLSLIKILLILWIPKLKAFANLCLKSRGKRSMKNQRRSVRRTQR